MKLCYFQQAPASWNCRLGVNLWLHGKCKISPVLYGQAETIETAKYSVFTVGIHYKAVYDVLSIKE